jgi:hypothetical protein
MAVDDTQDEKNPGNEVKQVAQVTEEAVEANRRLGYLDLSKPVEESTVHNVTSSKVSRRHVSQSSLLSS